MCLALVLLSGCAARVLPAATDTPIPEAEVVRQSGIFTVSGGKEDRQVVEDVLQALQDNLDPMSGDLDFEMKAAVRVEIFADQESLDREGMNPEMKGYYAYSGSRRIQMVSPRNPMPGLEIPYDQRLLVAVHELAHLVLNEINPDMPLWLNEGTAVYAAPHGVYDYVCQTKFPFDRIPTLIQLEEAYYAVPPADLFAYLLVDYISTEYGREALNRLLRDPARMEDILGASRADLERGWVEDMTGRCKAN